jgi:CHASE2 domain-containing sensor protein
VSRGYCQEKRLGLRIGQGAGSEHIFIGKTQSVLAYRLVCGRSGGVAVVILHQSTDFIGTMERRFYDFASTSSARQPSDRVAVIAIDDQSIANIGRWPWPRDIHAQLIDQLAAAKAKTIVHTAFFFEPQTDRGLVFIRKMKEALGPGADPGAGGLGEQLGKVIAEAELALDTDAKLATA